MITTDGAAVSLQKTTVHFAASAELVSVHGPLLAPPLLLPTAYLSRWGQCKRKRPRRRSGSHYTSPVPAVRAAHIAFSTNNRTHVVATPDGARFFFFFKYPGLLLTVGSDLTSGRECRVHCVCCVECLFVQWVSCSCWPGWRHEEDTMNVPIVAGDLDDEGYKPRFVRVSSNGTLRSNRFAFVYKPF